MFPDYGYCYDKLLAVRMACYAWDGFQMEFGLGEPSGVTRPHDFGFVTAGALPAYFLTADFGKCQHRMWVMTAPTGGVLDMVAVGILCCDILVTVSTTGVDLARLTIRMSAADRVVTCTASDPGVGRSRKLQRVNILLLTDSRQTAMTTKACTVLVRAAECESRALNSLRYAYEGHKEQSRCNGCAAYDADCWFHVSPLLCTIHSPIPGVTLPVVAVQAHEFLFDGQSQKGASLPAESAEPR